MQLSNPSVLGNQRGQNAAPQIRICGFRRYLRYFRSEKLLITKLCFNCSRPADYILANYLTNNNKHINNYTERDIHTGYSKIGSGVALGTLTCREVLGQSNSMRSKERRARKTVGGSNTAGRTRQREPPQLSLQHGAINSYIHILNSTYP